MSDKLVRHQRLRWVVAIICTALCIGSLGLTTIAAEEPDTVKLSTTNTSPNPPYPLVNSLHHIEHRPTIVPDQYLVILKENSGRAAQVRSVASRAVVQAGGQINREYATIFNGLAITLDSEKAVAELKSHPLVASVQPNKLFYVSDSPQEDPVWGLDRIDQVSLPLNNEYGYLGDGTGVHAFIIDTGILTTHVEFAGRIGEGYDFYNDDSDPTDDHWHGTHVAGTVGGTQYGVAKDVTLHGLKVCSGGGNCPHDVILSAYEWVINRPERPAVINMSLGGVFDQATNDAITAAVEAGIVVVVAAGNSAKDACESTPGSSTEALVVGASDSSDALAHFTNYGSCVDLFAPGVGVLSAHNSGVTATQTANGTSMASPHVAGAAAIYLEAGHSPAATVDAIIDSASSGQLTGLIGDSPDKLLYQAVTPFDVIVSPATQTSCAPSGSLDITHAVHAHQRLPFAGNVTLSSVGAPGAASFGSNPLTALPATTTLTVTSVATGDHTFAVVGSSVMTPSLVVTRSVRQHVAQTAPGAPTLTTPSDSATDQSRRPTLSWGSVSDTFTYTVSVATDGAFSSVVHSQTLTATAYTVPDLAANTTYYWRVTAGNGCGQMVSGTRQFTTRSARLYVDRDASGSATGLSWTDAYTDLVSALTEAINGDSVWVAEGMYRPAAAGGDRNASFEIKQGVAVYGGFVGNETDLNSRNSDPASNNTVLTGDLNGDDSGSSNLGENSYSVVHFDIWADDSTILDGFGITGGNANGTGNLAEPDTGGGGVYLAYGQPKLRNLIISNNYAAQAGAGLSTYGDPMLDNVLFSGNVVTGNGTDAELYGGGFFSLYGSPTLRDVTFRNNHVYVNGDGSIASGGGFIQVLGSTTLVNVLFEANSVSATNVGLDGASAYGGGFRNLAAAATLVNVSFVGNSAESADIGFASAKAHGGGLYSSYTNTLVTNAIFSNNHVSATSAVSSEGDGAAIFNLGFMTMTNGTLYANHGTGSGGGVYNAPTEGSTTPTFDATNSVFWQNSDAGGVDNSAQVHDTSTVSTIAYSILQGGWSGTANLDTDPLFIDANGADDILGTGDDDFRGQYNSPMLDVGLNSALPLDALDMDADADLSEQIPFDQALQTRIVNTTVDYGAIETQVASVMATPGSSTVLSKTAADGSEFSAELPAGSVTETVELVYITQESVVGNPTGLAFAGQAFSLDVAVAGSIQAEYTFQQPISITLTYTDADIATMDESTLLIHYYDTDSGTWINAATSCSPVSSYVRDMVNNRLTVAICHLTEFGMFGASTPTAISMQGSSAETGHPSIPMTILLGIVLFGTLMTLGIVRQSGNQGVMTRPEN